MATSLRVSVSTAGQLTSLFAVLYAVGSPSITTLAGNWDRRVLLAAGMAMFTVGVVIQAAGSTVPSEQRWRTRDVLTSAPPA